MLCESVKNTVYQHLLMHSRQNPIKAADLAGMVGLSLRDINDVIRQMRKGGVLIGASRQHPYGYYIPGSIDEAKECIRSMRSEMFDLIRTHQKMRKAFKEFVDTYRSGDLYATAKTGSIEMVLQ